MPKVTEAQMEQWRAAIGREQTETARLDGAALERFAKAIGCDGPPRLGHWACFLPSLDDKNIGPDGHPRRGAFLPAVSLGRRMFASSEIVFHEPLMPGADATRTSRVADLSHKQGASGDLIFAKVAIRIEQDGVLRVSETQTYVYRDTGAPIPLPDCDPHRDQEESWTPQEVNLFRFSAATGNAHRIHYDLPYARDIEGYPALVVHGPFTAARLSERAARDGTLASFDFRASAPMFCGQPIALRKVSEGHYEAVRCDGVTGMTAHATFR